MTTKHTNKAKRNKQQSLEPWASVTEHQAKIVRDKVDALVSIAVWGKGSSDGCCTDEITIEEAIDNLVDVASSAFICLLLLNPTRAQKDQKPGPLAHISKKEAKGIREQLQFALDFGIDAVRGLKRCKKFQFVECFSGFSVLKKYAKEIESYLCPESEDE